MQQRSLPKVGSPGQGQPRICPEYQEVALRLCAADKGGRGGTLSLEGLGRASSVHGFGLGCSVPSLPRAMG